MELIAMESVTGPEYKRALTEKGEGCRLAHIGRLLMPHQRSKGNGFSMIKQVSIRDWAPSKLTAE